MGYQGSQGACKSHSTGGWQMTLRLATIVWQSRVRPLLPLILLALMLTTLSGCGYSGKSLYPTSIRTVAVPIFANRTFRRQWEFRLTEAIDKNIESRTPFRLAPKERPIPSSPAPSTILPNPFLPTASKITCRKKPKSPSSLISPGAMSAPAAFWFNAKFRPR